MRLSYQFESSVMAAMTPHKPESSAQKIIEGTLGEEHSEVRQPAFTSNRVTQTRLTCIGDLKNEARRFSRIVTL